MPSRLSIAKPDIVQAFKALPHNSVLTRADIDRILIDNRAFWRLAQSTTTNDFIEFLLDSTDLLEVRFDFSYRPVIRYTWGEVPGWTLVQSINKSGYFSHYSAIELHGLTEQKPSSVYFNCEQALTGGGGQATQAGIDRAFRGKCRTTTNIAKFPDRSIHLLNGKNTGRLGVSEITTSAGERLFVTNLERTLIDATVRPIYSGGVFEVAKAFTAAADNVSINRLTALLRQLNFVYPYHQAIGFYLTHSGRYSPSQIQLLKVFPQEFDFYLDYGLKQTEYVAEWKLFVPKGF